MYIANILYLVEDTESGSESDIQGEDDLDDEGSDNPENDDYQSDGYLSDSGSDGSSDVSEHDDVEEKTSDVVQPYLPPQLQSKTSNVKLRKSINGLINRY